MKDIVLAVGSIWGILAFIRTFILQEQISKLRSRIEALEDRPNDHPASRAGGREGMKFLLLSVVFLCGCVTADNRAIVRDTKYCLDSGMAVSQDDFGYIHCVPRKEQKP